jgi:predicted Ser/Thr protein kinase
MMAGNFLQREKILIKMKRTSILSPTSCKPDDYVTSQNNTAKLTVEVLDHLHRSIGNFYVELGMRFGWEGIVQNRRSRDEMFDIQEVWAHLPIYVLFNNLRNDLRQQLFNMEAELEKHALIKATPTVFLYDHETIVSTLTSKLEQERLQTAAAEEASTKMAAKTVELQEALTNHSKAFEAVKEMYERELKKKDQIMQEVIVLYFHYYLRNIF